MTVELDGRVIRGVDINNQFFRNKWANLPGAVQKEALNTIRSLFGTSLDSLPRKLHLHQLVNRQVSSVKDAAKKVNVWSLHLTSDDRYKASFTFEDGTIYFRTCGVHEAVDKTP